MGKHFDDALKHLAADDVGKAENILSSIQYDIEQLQEDRDLIQEMIERKRGAAKSRLKAQRDLPLDPPPKLRIKKRIPGGLEQRSAFIKAQAEDMAKANSGKVTVDQMKEALASYNLGTNIPGTVIANVLFKAHGWKRLERGVFQYLGPE